MRRKGSRHVQQLLNLKRYLGLLLLGLLLVFGIVGPQAVSANDFTPEVTGSLAAPQIKSVIAGRDAADVVWVQVVTENISAVDLLMPGTVTLVQVNSYSVFDLYVFTVTGLTPDEVYPFKVDAHGYRASLVPRQYISSVQA